MDGRRRDLISDFIPVFSEDAEKKPPKTSVKIACSVPRYETVASEMLVTRTRLPAIEFLTLLNRIFFVQTCLISIKVSHYAHYLILYQVYFNPRFIYWVKIKRK
jgi:hypothetical protein